MRARGRGSGDGGRGGEGRRVRGPGASGARGERATSGYSRARRRGPEVPAPLPAVLGPPPAPPPPEGRELPSRGDFQPRRGRQRVPRPPASALPARPASPGGARDQERGARLRLCSRDRASPGRRTFRREGSSPAGRRLPALGALTRCAPGRVRGARRPEARGRGEGSQRSGGRRRGGTRTETGAGDHSVRGQWGEGWGRGAGPEEGRDLLPPTPRGARLPCPPPPLALRPGPPPTRLRTRSPGNQAPAPSPPTGAAPVTQAPRGTWEEAAAARSPARPPHASASGSLCLAWPQAPGRGRGGRQERPGSCRFESSPPRLRP